MSNNSWPKGTIMTISEIVAAWLKEKGYDGLFNVDGECACALHSGGLMPCCDDIQGCMPGYHAPCDCGDHDWHIVAKQERRDET